MSTSPPSVHQQRKLQSAERAKMVHHQRYHQLKKGFPVVRKEDETDDEENQTLVLDFGSSTANYYKRTTPKLMFFYFLFLFSFLSCCLVFGPQLFTLYTNDGLADSEIFVPICSSIASGTMCCDRSNIRSDICYMKGDIRTQSSTSSIILYSSNGVQNGVLEDDVSEVDEEEEEDEIQHEKIKPYTRKWEKSVMDTIDELDLIVKKSNSRNKDHCDVTHSVPAVVFSTGGYTGNVYHEFNDGIIPLYVTSQHLNKEVVFVLLEYHEWWITKYTNIVSHLSNYPVINFSGDNRTHCFPEVIVGCRIHDELTIDPALMPGNKSIEDFHNLLDRAYWPRINGLIHDEEEESQKQLKPRPKPKPRHLKNKPKLVIVSRNGSRAITNEDSMVEMAKEIGFEVDVLRPDRTSELAKIYRALNSSDMMIGVHGAAMTHFLFMRPGSVFIQVVPLGTDWAAETYYGDPAVKLGLKYIGYKILPRESSLYLSYHRDDPVLRDPDSVNAKGWEYTKKIYLDGQNVKLELGRFRKRLVRAYDYLSQRNRRHRRRHLR